MPFTFSKLPVAVFLLFLTVNSVFGLYKLQPVEGKEGEPNLLVAEKLAKKDYIYLYLINRTSFAPSQAPLNQFIEGLLILMGVKFHRVPNQFFLGSKSTGSAPFIQFNGKYYDGVEKILEFLRKNQNYKGKIEKLPTFENDKNVQKFALDISFKILMKDRSRPKRTKKEGGNEASTSTKTIPPIQKSSKQEMTEEEKKANSEMEGIDFMLYDQGIREQMFPAVPGQLGKKDLAIGKFKVKELTGKFLSAYFDSTNDGRKRDAKQKYQKFKENVVGLNETNWDEFEKAMEAYITFVLNVVLISNNGNASVEKLIPLLEQNKYEDGRTYAEIDEAELYNIFMDKLDKLVIHTIKKTKTFLGGNKPSIADMALFSILVQFFDTPLNIPEFKQLFQPNRLNADDIETLKDEERKAKYEKHTGKNVEEIREILAPFYSNMKKHLGLEGDRWTLLTQKPWPLNYEDIWRKEYPNKYDGPYFIETNDLEVLSKGNSNGNSLLTEIVEKVKSKAKEMFTDKKFKQKVLNFFKGLPYTELNLQKNMLAETAAYLCNLGPGKVGGEECRKKHAKNSTRIPEETRQQIRKIVYGTIVDYNDRLLLDKVTMETNRVADMLTEHPNNVAKYSSSLKIGNEN